MQKLVSDSQSTNVLYLILYLMSKRALKSFKQILNHKLRLLVEHHFSVVFVFYFICQVDRSVSGLIAQQQCVGPLHTPLADVAVIALSHFDTVRNILNPVHRNLFFNFKRIKGICFAFQKGAATAIGEQPIKCLVDSMSGARMTVGESLTNLVFASVGCLKVITKHILKTI